MSIKTIKYPQPQSEWVWGNSTPEPGQDLSNQIQTEYTYNKELDKFEITKQGNIQDQINSAYTTTDFYKLKNNLTSDIILKKQYTTDDDLIADANARGFDYDTKTGVFSNRKYKKTVEVPPEDKPVPNPVPPPSTPDISGDIKK